ncbi:hypothetical protein L218DRAFT_944296 [Marasmius fiardii PR-910]|nr:hypothetical protein L218DRAFT_944296 [Marasmius fiardii PR-910]
MEGKSVHWEKDKQTPEPDYTTGNFPEKWVLPYKDPRKDKSSSRLNTRNYGDKSLEVLADHLEQEKNTVPLGKILDANPKILKGVGMYYINISQLQVTECFEVLDEPEGDLPRGAHDFVNAFHTDVPAENRKGVITVALVSEGLQVVHPVVNHMAKRTEVVLDGGSQIVAIDIKKAKSLGILGIQICAYQNTEDGEQEVTITCSNTSKWITATTHLCGRHWKEQVKVTTSYPSTKLTDLRGKLYDLKALTANQREVALQFGISGTGKVQVISYKLPLDGVELSNEELAEAYVLAAEDKTKIMAPTYRDN